MASSARTTPAGTAVSQRACLRCIAKKRRCDHERPVCGSCGKLKVSCEYPPPQSRRGPVPGLSKRAEWRVQQCENALWYLLNVPGVTAAVKRASAASTNANRTTAPNSGGASNNNNIVGNGHGNGAAAAAGNGNGGATGTSTRAGSAEDTDATLPCAPTSTLDREARAEWWSSHRLDTAGDILEFQRACRKLAGESGTDDDEEDTALPTEVAPEPRPATAAAPVTSSSPAPQPTTPSQIYTPASSSLRNSMGPSLWQLVTAAIPDSDSAGFARELRELRARRERAVTAAGDADMATTTTTTDLPQSPLDREQLERDRERDRELSREQREHEGETETERELRRLRRIESDMDGQMREQNIEQDREAELRRKREQARAEIAIFEAAIAREAEEVRSYELRRMREREEREREAARQRAAAEEGERNNNAATEEETERDRFPGLRLPLGMLPNEHLAWTYGAGGMGGVGGAGKRRRLEDMFW